MDSGGNDDDGKSVGKEVGGGDTGSVGGRVNEKERRKAKEGITHQVVQKVKRNQVVTCSIATCAVQIRK